MGTTTASKYESVYGNLKKVKRPCVRCGRITKRRIDPADRGHFKVFCHHCKAYLDRHPQQLRNHDKSNAPIESFVRAILLNHGAGPVTVYRPGDPGFEEIAAECSMQPKQEKPYYDAFDGKNYFDGRR